jgi:hypothetical protein
MQEGGSSLGRVWRRLVNLLAPRRPPGQRPPTQPAQTAGAYDYDGPVRLLYAPERDGDADPGEVVWTWVPYEEDPSQGKDRPVVVVGRVLAGRLGDLAVVMLSSRDHSDDPDWLVLGRGGWDREGRVSSVRLDRVFGVPADAVRREGAALDRPRFDKVAQELRGLHGWV